MARASYIDGPVGLGHRRLAIIDLSDAAAQPMANEDGDVVLIYNGEIYNFQELRVELEALGHRFRSQTDTEVIVHAYEEWGDRLRRAAQRDVRVRHLGPARRRRLFLARDRYGVKPLYWYVPGRRLPLRLGDQGASSSTRDVTRRASAHEALNEYFTLPEHLLRPDAVRGRPAAAARRARSTLEPTATPQPQVRRCWDYPVRRDEPT